jgi:hypothetical protein
MPSAKKPNGTRSHPPLDLCGCCFIVWGEGKEVQYEGWIRSRPEPGLYLVQYFEAFMGSPSTMAIMPVEKMIERPWAEPGSMLLFTDDEHLRFWMEYRYRPPRDQQGIGEVLIVSPADANH